MDLPALLVQDYGKRSGGGGGIGSVSNMSTIPCLPPRQGYQHHLQHQHPEKIIRSNSQEQVLTLEEQQDSTSASSGGRPRWLKSLSFRRGKTSSSMNPNNKADKTSRSVPNKTRSCQNMIRPFQHDATSAPMSQQQEVEAIAVQAVIDFVTENCQNAAGGDNNHNSNGVPTQQRNNVGVGVVVPKSRTTPPYAPSSSSSSSSALLLASRPGATCCTNTEDDSSVAEKMAAWDRMHGASTTSSSGECEDLPHGAYEDDNTTTNNTNNTNNNNHHMMAVYPPRQTKKNAFSADGAPSHHQNNYDDVKPGARFCPHDEETLRVAALQAMYNGNGGSGSGGVPSASHLFLERKKPSSKPDNEHYDEHANNNHLFYPPSESESVGSSNNYTPPPPGARFYPSSFDEDILEAKTASNVVADNPASAPDTPQESLVEIAPGVQARLRGAQETMEAIAQDFYVPVTCFCCESDWFCIADATYVLCPTCRVVIPLCTDGDSQGDAPDGGVGMGFSLQDLQEMQLQILRQDRQQQQQRQGGEPGYYD